MAKFQPAKLAAFEGLYHTTNDAPLTLAGYVDEPDQKVVGLQMPGLLSFLVAHNTQATVTGLDAFPPQDRPPVEATFLFFHGMVGIGFA